MSLRLAVVRVLRDLNDLGIGHAVIGGLAVSARAVRARHSGRASACMTMTRDDVFALLEVRKSTRADLPRLLIHCQ